MPNYEDIRRLYHRSIQLTRAGFGADNEHANVLLMLVDTTLDRMGWPVEHRRPRFDDADGLVDKIVQYMGGLYVDVTLTLGESTILARFRVNPGPHHELPGTNETIPGWTAYCNDISVEFDDESEGGIEKFCEAAADVIGGLAIVAAAKIARAAPERKM